jgi:hypothetical protein
MTLLTEKDFETKSGQKRIIYTIHQLEVKVRELSHLVHDCLEEEDRLERDLEGLD